MNLDNKHRTFELCRAFVCSKVLTLLPVVQARVPTPAREAQEATASSRPTSQEIASQIEGFDDDFKVTLPQHLELNCLCCQQ